MKLLKYITLGIISLVVMSMISCMNIHKPNKKTAKDILGNSNYPAIAYSGYRGLSRDEQPTVSQIKEDLRILSAMGIKIIRTYNVHFDQTANILKAIKELKAEDSNFEMYVMLGAWINCKNAFSDLPPDHTQESPKNHDEIDRAIELANQYPDIVKIIAVGNEAMVRWAISYYVHPRVILKWVNYLQDKKKEGKLDSNIWITSSDNFASWGGGDSSYHVPELNQLIQAVDYISMHTYPMHDTHYNPTFWGVLPKEEKLSDTAKARKAVERALNYSISQYRSVKNYVKSLGIKKPIHIGETGWASYSNELYGAGDSRATDEYKSSLFYNAMRKWSKKKGISCFYFEAFDEPWKDAKNPGGSENHFGLFTVDGQAKYMLWDLVDRGIFKNLSRDGNPIRKTYDGNQDSVIQNIMLPPTRKLDL